MPGGQGGASRAGIDCLKSLINMQNSFAISCFRDISFYLSVYTEIHQHLTRSLRVSLRIRFSFSLIPKDLFTRKIIKHIFVHFQPSKTHF